MTRREVIGVLAMTVAFLLVVSGIGVYVTIALRPDTATAAGGDDLRDEADELLRRGKLAEAVTAYTRAIDLSPSADLFRARGDAYQRLGRDPEAERDYTRSIELDPAGNAAAYVSRSRTRTRLGKLEGAADDLAEVIVREPNMARAYRDRGRINQRLKNFSRAAADFRRARLERSSLVGIDSELGWALWGTGEYDRALDAFDEAVRKQSGRTHHHFGRGVTLLHLGQYESAIDALMRAAGRAGHGSDYAHYYLWLAMAHAARGPEADATLAAFVHNPSSQSHGPWSLRIGAFLLGEVSEDGLLEEATAGEWLGTSEQMCEAYYYAGHRRLLDGDTEKAVELFERSRATDRTNYYEWHSAGIELRKLGRGSSVE